MGLYSSTVAVIDDKPQNASESGWPHCQGGQLRAEAGPEAASGHRWNLPRFPLVSRRHNSGTASEARAERIEDFQ
jgi:hypothetical protein